MKISFVIPAYNEEALIGNCLVSVLKQTKKYNENVEIIVVNNASTDSTKEVASSFKGVIVVDEPMKSLVKARQAGFNSSTGDLVANIDADGILMPGWTEKVMDEFSKDKDLVALSGPCVFYDISKTFSLLVKCYYFVGYVSHIISKTFFHIDAMLQGGNFVLRRSALQKIGGFDTSIAFYGEDADIAKRIQKVGKIKFDFKLLVYSSPRRLQKEGLLKTAWHYGINYIWILIFGRPFSKDYSDVRSQSSL